MTQCDQTNSLSLPQTWKANFLLLLSRWIYDNYSAQPSQGRLHLRVKSTIKPKPKNKTNYTHYTANTQNVFWHVFTKIGRKFNIYTTLCTSMIFYTSKHESSCKSRVLAHVNRFINNVLGTTLSAFCQWNHIFDAPSDKLNSCPRSARW